MDELITLGWLLTRVVVCPSGCYLWVGANSGVDRNARGSNYPKFKFHGETMYVHREVHRALVGPVPHDYQVDHICARWGWDPWLHRLCVRPEHLEAVPDMVNQRRKFR